MLFIELWFFGQKQKQQQQRKHRQKIGDQISINYYNSIKRKSKCVEYEIRYMCYSFDRNIHIYFFKLNSIFKSEFFLFLDLISNHFIEKIKNMNIFLFCLLTKEIFIFY